MRLLERIRQRKAIGCAEDEAGKMDAVMMPRLYEQQKENIQKDRICLIQGKKDRPSSIVVNKIEWIEV